MWETESSDTNKVDRPFEKPVMPGYVVFENDMSYNKRACFGIGRKLSHLKCNN